MVMKSKPAVMCRQTSNVCGDRRIQGCNIKQSAHVIMVTCPLRIAFSFQLAGEVLIRSEHKATLNCAPRCLLAPLHPLQVGSVRPSKSTLVHLCAVPDLPERHQCID
eukprot:scpid102971/ scgid19858/ 